MSFKGKKILVTGGSGFIGTNLIKKLEKIGAKIENFDQSEGHNIQDKRQLEKIIKKEFDIIYHLAGFSGSSESNLNREKSFRINTLATINLFELISKYSPLTKIILSSSRLEYGKPQYLPVDEKHPTVPTSAYGLSKLITTLAALVKHRSKGLNVVIFRTSNVYGSHTTSKFSGYNIINHFIDLAKQGKSLTIFGNGNQIRDYLYIDDLVDAFMLGVSKICDGEIYNLGLGEGIKFKEMANLIVKYTASGKLKYADWPEGYKDVETGDYITDISKIKKDLGFKPKINFEYGIKKTLQSINYQR